MGWAEYFDGGRLQWVLSELSYHSSIEHVASRWIKRVIWRGPGHEPRMALTFDDGPHPEFTPRLLEILTKLDVTATFFVIGKHVERHVSIAEAIRDRGHELANHTYTHRLLPVLSRTNIREEIEKTHDVIGSIQGRPTRWIRPPMGLATAHVLNVVEEMQYHAVVGDVYPRDPHRPGRDKIVRRILDRSRNGSIVILHDSGTTERVDRSQTLDAVATVVPRLRDRGYRFCTLSELLA
jgi:peptidoglycan/xylan/chitin deacetylase (PgdA/CDA1 family)